MTALSRRAPTGGLVTVLRLSPAWWLLHAAAGHLAGQQQARRNALVGATALAGLRLERLEVEEFLAARAAQPGPDRPPAILRSAG